MRKLSVLLAILLFSAASVSVSAQDWGAGVRLGSGFQAMGQRYLANGNYLEARLGMDWIYGDITANFSFAPVWNVANMDWSPEGNWFFDLGPGVYLGGKANYFVCGIMGLARLGYEFEDVPIRLAFDWSPSFGPEIAYGRAGDRRNSISRFNARGLANLGLSFIYRF